MEIPPLPALKLTPSPPSPSKRPSSAGSAGSSSRLIEIATGSSSYTCKSTTVSSAHCAPRAVRPSNHLSISRDGAAITGTYVVDPAVHVPEWFLGEESEDEGTLMNTVLASRNGKKKAPEKGEKRRPNVKFGTRSGDVDVDLWVCEGCVAARSDVCGSSAEGVAKGDDGGNEKAAWESLWAGGSGSDGERVRLRQSYEKGKLKNSSMGEEDQIRHAEVEAKSESGSVSLKLVRLCHYFRKLRIFLMISRSMPRRRNLSVSPYQPNTRQHASA